MGQFVITSLDEEVEGRVSMEINNRNPKLVIKKSKIDHVSPEMYNYKGEPLIFIESSYEMLGIDIIEKGSAYGRKVLTLAKMEKNIASGGKSYKINPAYGIETSKVESYTIKMKNGEALTLYPQEGQHQFYSNQGTTKILGILEMAGNVLDFVSILRFGLNNDEKEMLPFPGPLATLNLAIENYLSETDEVMAKYVVKEIEDAICKGLNNLKKVVRNRMFEKMGYGTVKVSNETILHIINGDIKTINEVFVAFYESTSYVGEILYRTILDDDITVIEAFFFDIE